MDDVELISINKDSILHHNYTIPSIPNGLVDLQGAQLPNSDLVICGGRAHPGLHCSDEYLHYKEGSNQWKKLGTMKRGRFWHSSVWIDGQLLTTGRSDSSMNLSSLHEEFSFGEGVKERKEMPIDLGGHTSTIFGQHKMIVCGGWNDKEMIGKVRKTFFKLRFETRNYISFEIHFLSK